MLTLNQTSLNIELDHPSQRSSEFHYVWLRDNCGCTDCVHPDTLERTLVTAEIADDIAPQSADISDTELVVAWNDGHHSRYAMDWLKRHDYSHSRFQTDLAAGEIKLWGSEIQNQIPEYDYRALHDDDQQTLLNWCCDLRDYGLTIVRNAPLKEAEIERFAEFVAVVREVIYDRLHNVRATPGEYNAYNVASTTLELKPHTDMPCYNNPPGVQMFHFLANETEGGESTAVDGFKVAEQLKQQDPEAYEILTKMPVFFQMDSARGDIASGNPLLTLDTDGKLKVFRFSNQLARPSNIPAEQMEAFYAAYKKIGRLIEAPENKVQFRLETGDIMVTNNLRVMHGRNAYSGAGQRHLQLSYMDMDDVLSRIRMIKKTQVAA